MEFLNSKKFIVIMLIVLVWAGLSGCTPTEYDKQAPHETTTEMNDKITKEMEVMDKEQAAKDNPGPTDFTGIAEMLGCMFAPNDCVLEKRKQEKEMDR
jgi:hypothetical protein